MSAPLAQHVVARPRRGRPPTPGLRQKILRAAEAAFTRHDYHEVQIDDVAAACGAGKGTVYRYFPSKQALFLGVMFEGIAQLRAELAAVAGTDDPPAVRLRNIVHQTLAYFWDRRFFFSLIHRNEHKADGGAREWARHREALTRVVRETLEAAMSEGHVRRVDARIATEMLFGMMRGVNRYRTRDDRLDDLVASVVEIFMNGIGTPAGRRMVPRARA